MEQTVVLAVTHAPQRHQRDVSAALRAVAAAGDMDVASAAITAFERSPLGEKYHQIVEQWRLWLLQWNPLFCCQ